MKLKTLKNKYALAYPLLALSLVLGSCSQEEGDNTIPEIDSQRKTITFTANPVNAETKNISTRVSLNTGSSNGNDGLDWVNNDKVSFYFIGENSNNVKKTFTVNVGGTTTITGETPETEGDYTIFAISPYKSTYFPTYGSTTLTIPASLTQDPDPDNLTHNHLSDYIYMYANPSNIVSIEDDRTATGGDIALDFNLLISLLRFEIVNNSSSDIKLHSVSISYPDESAKLYSTLELDEETLTFSPTNASHEKMTLSFSDIALASGNGRGAYLPLFPTTSALALNIDANILLPDNTPRVLKYVINDIRALKASERYIIPIIITEEDVPYSTIPGQNISIIDGESYVTYTINSGGNSLTWMVQPLRLNSEVVYHPGEYNDCPGEWRWPNLSELTLLFSTLSNSVAVKHLFCDYAPSPASYNNDGPSYIPNNYTQIHGGSFSSNSYSMGISCITIDRNVNPTQGVLYVSDATGVYVNRPVRCVKN